MFETKKFKTKTTYIERNNTSTDEHWIIGADIGYSGVKLMSPAICASFPSYAARLPHDLGMMGEVSDEYILYTDLKTGEKWIVGQYAQNDISDRDTSVTEEALFGRERYEDPMFRVIINTALGIGSLPGRTSGPEGRKLIIQSGFPPAYETDKPDLTDAFCGARDFSLQIGNSIKKDFHFNIAQNQVELMAQPMGTLFSVLVDSRGMPIPDMRHLFKKNVIIFDAGFGTLDLFPIRNGRLEKSQTNQTLGMKRVMQETCRKLQESGVNVSVPALQKYLDTGNARYHTRKVSKNVPFGNILKSASDKICDEAVSWMTQMFPLYEYDYLIITGGTGAAWSGRIRGALRGMETLKIIDGNCNDTLPYIFANVRGYYLYRYSKLARS